MRYNSWRALWASRDLLDLGNHAEAAARAFGLHLVADHLLHFAVADNLQHLLPDEDLIILEVDVAPRQPKCLASSQSAIDGKDDGDIDDVLFGVFEQCFDLVHRVEVADELLRLRTLHSVHGIVFEDLLADGVFEGGVQQIVIMQNRLLAVAVLSLVIVEAVNEAGLAVGERDLFVKVFRYLSAHSSFVAVVCGLLDLVDVYTVEPVVYELQKRIFGRIVVPKHHGMI